MLVHYTFTSTHLLACIYTSTWLNINIIKTFSPHHFVEAFNNNLKKKCCWTSHYKPNIINLDWAHHSRLLTLAMRHLFVVITKRLAKKNVCFCLCLFFFLTFVCLFCVCVFESVSCGVTKLQNYNAQFSLLLLILEKKATKRWREKKKN
jgi:hypothetical protein